MRFFLYSLCVLFSVGCSSVKKQPVVRIGIDLSWYSLDVGAQQPYVNGFISELLLEISKKTHVAFDMIHTSWDHLYEGLHQNEYEYVLSSLEPYPFYLPQYSFSENLIDLGTVLVLALDNKSDSLSTIKEGFIGVLGQDPATRFIALQPHLLVRSYPSIPSLLEDVVSGVVQGSLLNRLAAFTYVTNLYQNKLKVVLPPLSQEGIHFVSLKKEETGQVSLFNQGIQALKEDGTYTKLLKKWQMI